MYDRILVPTDGSVGTAHVALHAIELAAVHGSTVHAITVIDSEIASYLGEADSDSLDVRADRTVGMVEQMADSHDVSCETEIRTGDPAESILQYADEVDVDLIVVGTHGRSGLARHLVGSVTERLVRFAHCPVLTLRLPETDVTVEDADHARRLIAEGLSAAGYEDVSPETIERQLSVWVGTADTDEGHVVVYLDPKTQRTSVLPQE